MSDVYVGAAIVLITLVVEETVRYFYSIRVEREKLKLKQKEDANNFKLNNIKKMKDVLIKLRVYLAHYYGQDVKKLDPLSVSKQSLDMIIELIKLKSDLYTYKETIKLGKSIDVLYKDVENFQHLILFGSDANKKVKAYKQLTEKIEKLLKMNYQ